MDAYRIKRTGRRTVGLEILEDGALLVRAPRAMTDQEIEALVRRHSRWIQGARARQAQRQARYPQPDEATLARYQAAARAFLPGRVAHFAGIMGLSPRRITVTRAKTRFGSCGPRGTLAFSCRLMAYPPEAIDYVVVHELAHLVHRHHGPDFYALVASILPDYRARMNILKGRG